MMARAARVSRERLPIPLLDLVALYIFGDLASKLVEKLRLDEKIMRAGLPVLPVQYAARMIFVAVLATFYAFSVAAMTYVLLPSPSPRIVAAMFLGVAMVPAMVFGYYMGKLSTAESTRRECVENELPLFAAYFSILARSGLSPEDSVARLANCRSLQCTSKEARRILALRYQRGIDVLTAMEVVAKSHPNRSFREFLEGFVSSMRTFSSPIEYLANATRNLIVEFESRVKSVAQRASMIATGLIMSVLIVLVFNMLTLFSSIIKLHGGANPLMNVLIPPLITGVIVMVIDKSVPRLPTRMEDVWMVFGTSLPIGIMAALTFQDFAAYVVPQPLRIPWEMAIALSIPSVIAWLYYRKIASGERGLVTGFVNFLRDLASGRRAGLPLEHVILSVRGYGNFDRILNVIKKGIALGMPLRRAIRAAFARVRTTVIKLLAEILADVLVLGGASPESLTTMENFITKIVEAMENLKRELGSSKMVPYIIVFINAFAVVMVGGMMAQMSHGFGGLGGLFAAGGVHVSKQMFNTTLETMLIGLVASSWLCGLLVGLLSELSTAAGLAHSALMTIMVPALSTVGLEMASKMFSAAFHP